MWGGQGRRVHGWAAPRPNIPPELRRGGACPPPPSPTPHPRLCGTPPPPVPPSTPVQVYAPPPLRVYPPPPSQNKELCPLPPLIPHHTTASPPPPHTTPHHRFPSPPLIPRFLCWCWCGGGGGGTSRADVHTLGAQPMEDSTHDCKGTALMEPLKGMPLFHRALRHTTHIHGSEPLCLGAVPQGPRMWKPQARPPKPAMWSAAGGPCGGVGWEHTHGAGLPWTGPVDTPR